MKGKIMLLAVFAAALLPGCSAQQAYGVAQGWDRNQCNRIPDKAEFDRCMSRTGATYDSYRQQTEPKVR